MKKAIVEAALFMAPGPLKFSQLSKICKGSLDEVVEAVEELRQEYEKRGGALEIVVEGDECEMRVRGEYLKYVAQLGVPLLSKAVMRTLALIFFKQPIELSRVAKIIGNRAYEYVKELEEKGFVVREKKGRKTFLKITKKVNLIVHNIPGYDQKQP